MGEILFRAESGNEWVYGDLIHLFGKNNVAIHHAEHEGETRNYIDIIPETVGQYTGTPDKNRNKIFECDIVKAFKNNEEPFVAVVTKRNGCFWFGNWNWCEFLDKFRNYEVIGNVFDNPELVKGGEQGG